MKAAQDEYAPHSICFGCGPANAKGLRIKSHWEGEDFVARWHAAPEHQAFPGMLNGGILGALLDCHSNWCAATTLMRERKLDAPPTTVTSEFHVHLRRPTPFAAELHLHAKPVAIEGDKVTIEAVLEADGKVCASCRGVFVAVREGHPAYHRWE
ncbi:MAG: PaaI family thioesterase [Thermoplasmatota archaeon]